MEDRLQKIGSLVLKEKNNSLNAQEKADLADFLNFSEANRLWYESFDVDSLEFKEKLSLYAEAEEEKPRAWLRLQKRYLIEKSSRRLIIWKRFAAAASLTLIITVGTRYFLTHKEIQKSPVLSLPETGSIKDIPPGSNKATLKLANGSTILLGTLPNGLLASQGTAKILMLNQGEISYQNSSNTTTPEILINSISTPRGGQYMLELSDGTKVWMNSASLLTYPTSFSGKNRQVTLSGEAYFEVAKDRTKPFLVSVGNSTVEVLGTHFNIKAYPDEEVAKTTLLEGSVKVSSDLASIVIRPNQQAQIKNGNSNDGIKVLDNVNTDGVVAWKNGHFHFENSSLQIVMKELSRWYDFDVEFIGPVTTNKYSGDIQKKLMFNQMISILSDNIHYSIKGKKIIVRP